MVNLTENSVDGDTHTVPTVHLNVPYGPAVKAYAKKSGAKATLREGNLSSTAIRYPQITSFSSRGPSIGNGGDGERELLTVGYRVAPDCNIVREPRLVTGRTKQ